VSVDDFKGLGRKQPSRPRCSPSLCCRLVGVPLTGGFPRQVYIFKAALASRLVWLTALRPAEQRRRRLLLLRILGGM